MTPMSALWLLLVPVALVGGFFLVRSFMRLTASIKAVRDTMAELAVASESLREVQAEVSRLTEAIDEVRRQ
jgi:hypothetical protein